MSISHEQPKVADPQPPDEFEFISRRSPVFGQHACVSSSQPLATGIGARILQQGGNAIDASVAVAAALAVTEPCSTGVGGDCFLLYYEKSTKKVLGLNGSGRCASALTLGKALSDTARGESEGLPPNHAHTVTVPGAVAGWCDAVAKWGSLPLRDILAPAVALAEHGFPVSPVTAHHWAANLYQLQNAAGPSNNAAELLIDNCRAPRCGEIFKNPGMARVLKAVAQHGKTAFYTGEIARSIATAVRDAGGLLSEDDLQQHTTTYPEPISVDFRGVRVYEVPPSGQGLTALLALNLLRHMDSVPTAAEADSSSNSSHIPSSAAAADAQALRLHAQIEALRLAFADTRYYCADPDVVHVPVQELLSDAYAAERSKLYNANKAATDIKYGVPINASCTVSFQVVDEQGNAVSFVNSNYMGFGTGIIPKGCGFSLQNRGANFSLDKNHPNCLAPGKRPYHTIIPCIATHAATGDLYATLTNMGAFMQPQGHVQLLCHLIERGLDPQTAIDRPRFCIVKPDVAADECKYGIAVEDAMSSEVVDRLRALGHKVTVISGNDRWHFGRAQIILKAQNGVLWAGTDGRADGTAIAW